MATHVPCKKNDANGYVFYVSLVSQADTKIFQANPTLAAGDVKRAIDDAAPSNLGTLPAVDADFTKRVKVTLSQAETNGDNITIIFSDAAGSEWCDLTVNIQTSAQTLDEIDTVADGIQTDLSNATDGLGALKALIDAVQGTADTIDSNIDIIKEAHILVATTIHSDNRGKTSCRLTAGSDNNDAYIGMWVILDDDAGDNEFVARLITDYVGATKLVTFTPTITEDADDGGNIYIVPGDTNIGVIAAAIKSVTDNLPDSGALNDLASILTDTGTSLPATLTTIAAYIDTEVQAIINDLANGTDGLGALLAAIQAISGGGDATAANQELLIKILTNKWEVTGNQLIMYDDDGSTPLYTFDLTQDGVPTEFNPDLRDPV